MSWYDLTEFERIPMEFRGQDGIPGTVYQLAAATGPRWATDRQNLQQIQQVLHPSP